MTDSLRKRRDLLTQIPARAKIPEGVRFAAAGLPRLPARAKIPVLSAERRSLKARAFAHAAVRFAAARLPARSEYGR
jgi:hypothetical protein